MHMSYFCSCIYAYSSIYDHLKKPEYYRFEQPFKL